jgi:hypothetical protein
MFSMRSIAGLRANAVRGTRAFSSTSPNALAKMTLIGRLTDAPEAIGTSTGREILKYSVATSTGRGDAKTSSFFRVTSFAEGDQRDFLATLPKG